jgi:hypothetical protein
VAVPAVAAAPAAVVLAAAVVIEHLERIPDCLIGRTARQSRKQICVLEVRRYSLSIRNTEAHEWQYCGKGRAAFIRRSTMMKNHQGEEQWTGRLNLGKYNGKPGVCRGYGPSGLEKTAKRSISREESSLNPTWLRFCGNTRKNGASMSSDCTSIRSESAFGEAKSPNPSVAHPFGRAIGAEPKRLFHP